MSFPNQTSLHGTIQQLKEIVTSLQGEDHEAARLVRQMEALAQEIERKSKQQTKGSPITIKPPGQPAPATV